MTQLFTCTDLCKNFRKKRALDGVTLSLEQGRIYGLVGLNGAGKTTLMRIMAGLIRPTSGSFTLFGESKGRALERSRRRVGFLIEDPVYFATMTAKQNLKAVAQIKAAKKVDYDSLLKAVGLEKESRSILSSYSTGMKQRYGLAAAMIGDPELLVLDEPTRGLDISGVLIYGLEQSGSNLAEYFTALIGGENDA